MLGHRLAASFEFYASRCFVTCQDSVPRELHVRIIARISKFLWISNPLAGVKRLHSKSGSGIF